MDLVKRNFKMDLNSKVILFKILLKVSVVILGKMEESIKAIGKTTKCQVKENLNM